MFVWRCAVSKLFRVSDVPGPHDRLGLQILLASHPGEIVAFVWRGLSITAGLGESGQPTELHIAVSRPDRDPTWDELKAVRYAFWPLSAEIVQFLPPPEEYVNVHQHCFHMHGDLDLDGKRRWVLGEESMRP